MIHRPVTLARQLGNAVADVAPPSPPQGISKGAGNDHR